MKKRGLKPTSSTYTSLINACSTSPWPQDGISRLNNLRELMLEKSFHPNQTHYHAMIKAYGRCGDIETAFLIVDEMIERQIVITSQTFNFLLQACITSEEAGFRHAILVWHNMLQKNVRPDLYTFNLLARCVRDCGLGGVEATNNVIESVVKFNTPLLGKGLPEVAEIAESNNTPDAEDLPTLAKHNNIDVGEDLELIENCPNLISRRPHLGNMVEVADIKKPEHRLLLLGGFDGFLQEMELYNISPNIKTFTQLLEAIPSTISAEQRLLNKLKKYNIEPDIEFFNILIKKRSMRMDYAKAKDVLRLIQKQRLTPDIVSFGVLAMSCLTLDEAKVLKHDISEVGYRMNVEILGALLRNATEAWDCRYIVDVMQTLLDEDVTPSPQFMGYLKKFYGSILKYREMAEISNPKDLNKKDKEFVDKINDKDFNKEFTRYARYYSFWITKAIPEEPPHPYAQFEKHEDDPEDVAVMNTGRK